MYCVQCSQLCTITDWPFRDTEACFSLTLFSISGLWLFYGAKVENNDEDPMNDDGEKINKEENRKKTSSSVCFCLGFIGPYQKFYPFPIKNIYLASQLTTHITHFFMNPCIHWFPFVCVQL